MFDVIRSGWFPGPRDTIRRIFMVKRDLKEVAEAAIEMYIFAQTYDIPRLRQDAMDRLVRCNNAGSSAEPCLYSNVSASTIQRAYQHTARDSAVRKWLAAHGAEFGPIDLDLVYPADYYDECVVRERVLCGCVLAASSMSIRISRSGMSALLGLICSGSFFEGIWGEVRNRQGMDDINQAAHCLSMTKRSILAT